MPTHAVDTCICIRSFPLPISFCVASQCPTFPVLVTLRHKACVRLIQAAQHCMCSHLAAHSQCPSVALLESYRACLWGIVGVHVSDPLDCTKGQLSVVTYPVTQSV